MTEYTSLYVNRKDAFEDNDTGENWMIY